MSKVLQRLTNVADGKKNNCTMFPLVNPRVPLEKGRTAREVLKELGLWEEYRLKYPYNPMAKFVQPFNTVTEPMTNDADVSNGC